MQGGTGNRPLLGKRSSFSNFSPYRGPPLHNGSSYQDQMIDSQHQSQQQQQQPPPPPPPQPTLHRHQQRHHFASFSGPSSSDGGGTNTIGGNEYGSTGTNQSAIRGHSHSHSHSHSHPFQQQLSAPNSSTTQQQQFSNGSSTYGYPVFTPPQYQQTPGHPLYSTYNHQSRRTAYYESHWPLYSTDWTNHEWTNTEMVAVGTFSEDQNTNKIQILHGTKPSPESLQLTHVTEAVVPYPATKLAWEPNNSTSSDPPTRRSPSSRYRMISTGDCLRVWDYDFDQHKLIQRSTLLNKSKSEFLPPLTSFDWNKVDSSLVITSSIDTTCTIWDINTSTARTQLIAHDSEVNDVAYVANSVDIFASVGADGSVRVFDLRSLDHSTIIYEPSNPIPLLRISANPHDRNVLAAVAQDSNKIYVLDIRFPGVPIATLDGHQRPVNSICWAPSVGKNNHRRHILASAGDDCQVLIWDLTGQQQQQHQPSSSNIEPLTKDANLSPIYSFTDTIEVNNISWSSDAEWLGVISGKGLQGVRFA